MLRVLILRGGLVALPFVVWLAWRAWSRHTGRPMGSTPWPWLFTAGAVLLGLSLIAGVVMHRDNRHEVYVPGEVTPSGAVTPGRFEEKAQPRR